MQNLSVKMFVCAALLLASASYVHSQTDCTQAQSCDLCVGDSMLNLTGCVWRLCPDGNDTGTCVTDEGNVADSSRNCSWTRVSELCTVVETVAEGGSDSGEGGKARPQLSPARFNLSSFIGGVLLVVCLQAVGVLAMRFLKSNEQSTYDPIEQPQ
ncbi:CD164 sialomucin-like 2 protein [Corythoichthys intestinalis]|uniref:CD164 sialomucin-like 2 protein n=1 Tax=Corythoichthys intestinalis TaxID=161448 RepID=UPI0025A5214B|nr:CD164 sialomucin-like 2 protein [Corythoichthys intestinalis]